MVDTDRNDKEQVMCKSKLQGGRRCGSSAGAATETSAAPTTAYTITDEDRTVYSLGECHLLAQKLHDLTGWPLVTIRERRDHGYEHIAVRAENGTLVDVHGAWDEEELLDGWASNIEESREEYGAECVAEPTDPALMTLISKGGGTHDDARLTQVAQAVLRDLKPH